LSQAASSKFTIKVRSVKLDLSNFDSLFTIQEVDVGLAADVGTLARLPKIVGNMSAVRELAMTAREFDAEEALRLGFISRVVPGGRDQVISVYIRPGCPNTPLIVGQLQRWRLRRLSLPSLQLLFWGPSICYYTRRITRMDLRLLQKYG